MFKKLILALTAASSIESSSNGNGACKRQQMLGRELYNITAANAGQLPLPDFKPIRKENISEVCKHQTCLKTDAGSIYQSSPVELKNTTELIEKIKQCDVKTNVNIQPTISNNEPPSSNQQPEPVQPVHYEDAIKELQRLFELAKQGTVPANLGDFLGKQDFLSYHLMHELFQSVNVIENNQTHTVPETLTIIQNLAPLMTSKGLSLHAPDSLGRTPWEFFTHRIFGEWRHLSFESVKPIFDLIMELTPKNDPYIQMAIGNLFIQSVTSAKEDQGLMNYTIELIKAYSLDINYQSPKVGMNRTALHRAAELEDESIVLNLFKMGADPTITDTHGNTPSDLVSDGTRLDNILRIAKILHPLMGASFNKLPMEAESWLGIYRRYRQFHDGILHVVTDPSNEQIKANLLKTWPFGSDDPINHPYFKKWTHPSNEDGNNDPPIINDWLDILGDNLAKRAINFFKNDRIPLPWGELTKKNSILLVGN